MSWIFLVDCNQFFVSCERAFNPALIGKPVVVLSCNDGCVVSRSKEAKAIGIKMGAPAYQCADLFKRHNVIALSSNFSLYGDMSRRVMNILHSFDYEMEEYSIDEAFLHITYCKEPLKLAKEIQEKILLWSAIPVSIGIATTKTLAKLANDQAKKNSGLFAFMHQEMTDTILATLAVEEIWGVGPRIAKFLHTHGIHFVKQFIDLPDSWIQKHLSVIALRLAFELRGHSCLEIAEEVGPRQSITCSRSFGAPVSLESDLIESVATHVTRAAEKLREQESIASCLSVFIMSSPFIQKPYHNGLTVTLEEPTDYTPDLIVLARQAVHKLFRPNILYKKTGVTLSLFSQRNCYQPDLLSDNLSKDKKTKAMKVLDELNENFGRRTLFFAAEGIEQSWKMKKANSSPHYTTDWNQLLEVKV